jgi:outer membrane protein TolC
LDALFSPGLILLFFQLAQMATHAQAAKNDSILQEATLENVIQYALTHQPSVQQALIDEAITDRAVKGKLADWYPQINFAYSIQHNFQLPTTVFQGNEVKIGVDNTSFGQFGLTQNIFNRDVILASKSASDVRLRSRQNTTDVRIEVTADVMKAFYAVLLSLQQIKIADEDIQRLQQNYKYAYAQYQAGLVDKTDYKRATIALNNSNAVRRTVIEALDGRIALLKQLMGYPLDSPLHVRFDSAQLVRNAELDTLQSVDVTKRIEFQLLQTQRKLLEAQVQYEKWGFLPTVSLFANYNLNFQNNAFGKLYYNSFPNSYVGVNLGIPIFQGLKRVHAIKESEWQLRRVDWDIVQLHNTVNTEFVQSMAAYKSAYSNYIALRENLDLAQDVFNVISLQYKSGVKAYIELFTAETDLRTAQIAYLNALFNLLSSRVDVQKSLGQLNY